MPDKPWKAFERKIAAALGTYRTPLSGGASRHTTSDTLHTELYVECKLRKASALDTAFRSIQPKAKAEDKIPIFVTRRVNSPLTLVTISWPFFLHLWHYWNRQGRKDDA